MDVRDSHSSSHVEGSSFQLHAIPLLSASSAYNDRDIEHGKIHSSRGSRDFHPEAASPESSTERFPDFEDNPYAFPTTTPRWRQLSISRPSFYVWARRFRLGAEKIADGTFFGVPPAGRRRRSLNCVLFLLAFAFIML